MAANKYSRYEVESEDITANDTKKTYRSAGRKAFYIILFLTILLVFAVLFCKYVFTVKKIVVEGAEWYEESVVVTESGFVLNENMLRIDKEKGIENILTKLPFIAEVSVEKQFPDTLLIKVTDAKAIAYIELYNRYYILSADMKVLAGTYLRPKDLIKLNLNSEYVTRCVEGTTLTMTDPKMDEALSKLCHELNKNEMNENIYEIRLKNRFNIYMEYEDRYTVFVGNTDQIEVKIAFLAGIVDKLTDDTSWKVAEGKENLDTNVGRIDISAAKTGTYSPLKR